MEPKTKTCGPCWFYFDPYPYTWNNANGSGMPTHAYTKPNISHLREGQYSLCALLTWDVPAHGDSILGRAPTSFPLLKYMTPMTVNVDCGSLLPAGCWKLFLSAILWKERNQLGSLIFSGGPPTLNPERKKNNGVVGCAQTKVVISAVISSSARWLVLHCARSSERLR